MTTLPWCRGKVLAHYYYRFLIIEYLLWLPNLANELLFTTETFVYVPSKSLSVCPCSFLFALLPEEPLPRTPLQLHATNQLQLLLHLMQLMTSRSPRRRTTLRRCPGA